MKKCPECGAKLEGADTSPCPKCHASLETGKPSKRKKRKAPKYLKKEEKIGRPGKKAEKNKKEKKKQAPESQQPADDGYDGYYDDVLPPDMDQVSEGIDKELVKKIVILITAVTFAIGICIAMLYFL